MSKVHIFELQHLINATDGNPYSIVDAVWKAGYRKPERPAEDVAQLTIDVFFECNMFGIPAKYWPENWESVLQNEMMKHVMGDDFDLNTRQIAERITAAGYAKLPGGCDLNAESQFAREPRLVSFALDMSTCTLNMNGKEFYFDMTGASPEAAK